MAAQLHILRPFQTARGIARKTGIDDSETIRRIREAQLQGREGHDIAGELRTRAWAIRNGYSTGPHDGGSAA